MNTFNDFENMNDDDFENSNDYDSDYKSETWGQENDLCDIADNCFGCPYAGECF